MAAGAIGPWAKALGGLVEAGGFEIGGDAWLVLLGAIAVTMGLISYARVGRGRLLSAICAGLSAVVCIYDWREIAMSDAPTLQVAWGLQLATIASIGVVVLSLLLPRVGKEELERMLERECPHCGSKIRTDVSVCRFCQRDVEPWTFHEGRWWKETNGKWSVWDEDAEAWRPYQAPGGNPTSLDTTTSPALIEDSGTRPEDERPHD
jgi:hypothetical protein